MNKSILFFYHESVPFVGKNFLRYVSGSGHSGLPCCWALDGRKPDPPPGIEEFTIGCNCSYPGYSGTVGYDFQVLDPVDIGYLGVYDNSGDGLDVATEVGLWGPSGLLTSAIVPSGTAGILDGQFRFVTLGTPVPLSQGVTYTLGALYTQPYQNDWYQAINSSAIFAPQFVYLNPAESSGLTLDRPVNGGQEDFGIFGPNLAPVAAPAPAPLPLLGAVGTFGWSRRLRQRLRRSSISA